jgi:hypothetical protein
MHTTPKKLAVICAAAAMLCAMPVSINTSSEAGLTLSVDQAQARVGRPLTPVSVAGVARRTTRRTVRRNVYYRHAVHCAWVNGVRVCR